MWGLGLTGLWNGGSVDDRGERKRAESCLTVAVRQGPSRPRMRHVWASERLPGRKGKLTPATCLSAFPSLHLPAVYLVRDARQHRICKGGEPTSTPQPALEPASQQPPSGNARRPSPRRRRRRHIGRAAEVLIGETDASTSKAGHAGVWGAPIWANIERGCGCRLGRYEAGNQGAWKGAGYWDWMRERQTRRDTKNRGARGVCFGSFGSGSPSPLPGCIRRINLPPLKPLEASTSTPISQHSKPAQTQVSISRGEYLVRCRHAFQQAASRSSHSSESGWPPADDTPAAPPDRRPRGGGPRPRTSLVPPPRA